MPRIVSLIPSATEIVHKTSCTNHEECSEGKLNLNLTGLFLGDRPVNLIVL